jgi:hypothetical protein
MSTRLSFDTCLQSGLVWKLRVDAKVDAVDVEFSFSYFRDVQCHGRRFVDGFDAPSFCVPGDVQLTLNIGFTVVFRNMNDPNVPFRKFLSEERKKIALTVVALRTKARTELAVRCSVR